jgi:hypothetical protein
MKNEMNNIVYYGQEEVSALKNAICSNKSYVRVFVLNFFEGNNWFAFIKCFPIVLLKKC